MPLELIDTLWNVNRLMTLILDEIAAELIDTLWNVNEEDWKIKSATITRINRYIMECKRIKKKNRRAHKTKELIDTLWNVNKSLALTVSPVFRINRYIMECKSYFFLTFCG